MVRRLCYTLLVFLFISRSFSAYFAQVRSQKTSVTDPEPSLPADHLSLASYYLENGDRNRACDHFRQYLMRHPSQWDIRAFYAELLLKDGRFAEAETQLRRYLADAQSDPLAMPNQLFQGHQRLMEIAIQQENAYDIHLQRGLALFWLARARRELGDINGKFSVESLLVKVAHEMFHAHRLEPDQARPCWYLSCVWRRLGRTQLASSWFQMAKRLSPFSQLTRYEQMMISLADLDRAPINQR